MTDREKKFHECVKRTLVFGNGKKIAPVFICAADRLGLDDMCRGSDSTITSSDPEYRENGLDNVVSGRNCIGCPFCKVYYYFGEAAHYLKDHLLVAVKNADAFPGLLDSLRSIVIARFLWPLIAKVKARCYLTLTERDCDLMREKAEMSSNVELIKLLADIEAFCKENNIK